MLVETKVLPNRRRRMSKGRAIRISDPVYNLLHKKRIMPNSNGAEKRISWDALMRRMLGLPNRRGECRPLLEGYLEVHSGRFYLNEAEANGASIVESMRSKRKRIKPVRMRELV